MATCSARVGLEAGSMAKLSERPTTAKANAKDAGAEVPLQVTVPPRVKHALAMKAAETGRTRRALVLEGLRKVGIDVSDEDIAGRRGTR